MIEFATRRGGHDAAPKPNSSAELGQAIDVIGATAHELGYDPFSTEFEIVPPHTMYEVASYLLPSRHSHWTFGMGYEQQKTMYDYGVSKIHEVVVNTNPAQAYLLDSNPLIYNKLVAAHVLGHTDFFKHNPAFADTNRAMVISAGLHADRIRQYRFDHGDREVEEFIDAVMSVQWLVDKVRPERPAPQEYMADGKRRYEERLSATGYRLTAYDDLFELGEAKRTRPTPGRAPFPYGNEHDIFWLIANFSPKPLEPWQKDIMDMMRAEAVYFTPQAATKILNEGWATYAHVQILRKLDEKGLLTGQEALDWIDLHAGVINPGRDFLQPYFLGYRMFENLARIHKGDPHPTGKKTYKDWKGNEFDESKYAGRDEYDPFWIRATIASDTEFLRNYLPPYLIEELVGEHASDYDGFEDDEADSPLSPEEIDDYKEEQLLRLINDGQPYIHIPTGGGDYRGNRELYLKHAWDERGDLDASLIERTLGAVQFLWGRPVHLEAMRDGETVIVTCKSNGDIITKKAS